MVSKVVNSNICLDDINHEFSISPISVVCTKVQWRCLKKWKISNCIIQELLIIFLRCLSIRWLRSLELYVTK